MPTWWLIMTSWLKESLRVVDPIYYWMAKSTGVCSVYRYADHVCVGGDLIHVLLTQSGPETLWLSLGFHIIWPIWNALNKCAFKRALLLTTIDHLALHLGPSDSHFGHRVTQHNARMTLSTILQTPITVAFTIQNWKYHNCHMTFWELTDMIWTNTRYYCLNWR